jgi:Protein of unknown function (DUF3107)
MNVRIGVLHTPKELEIEMDPETDFDDLKDDIDAVLAAGEGVLWLTDKRDRQVGVPVERIAWVDLTPRAATSRIGFGA